MVNADLPHGIPEILEHLAQTARGYNNHLKWNEIAMLKADLMNARTRWKKVSAAEIAKRCRILGMREEDITRIVNLVQKAQQGHRLVLQESYRNFRFNPPVD